jgi:hypothetical protein
VSYSFTLCIAVYPGNYYSGMDPTDVHHGTECLDEVGGEQQNLRGEKLATDFTPETMHSPNTSPWVPGQNAILSGSYASSEEYYAITRFI